MVVLGQQEHMEKPATGSVSATGFYFATQFSKRLMAHKGFCDAQICSGFIHLDIRRRPNLFRVTVDD